MKKLSYVLTGSVFLGTSILYIDVGIARISMYRMLLALILVYAGYLFLINKKLIPLSLDREENQYRMVYLFWLFSALISVLWAENISRWLNGTFFVATGVMSILILSYTMTNTKDIKRLFLIIYSMIGFHHLIGWIEILTGNYFWARLSSARLSQFASNPSLRMPFSIYTNINDYSTVIFASIPFAFIFYFNTNKLGVKILCVLSVLSTTMLLWRTGSRANQLALIVFVLILLLVKFLTRKMFKYITILTGALILLSMLTYFISLDMRLYLYNTFNSFYARGGSNVYRINMLINGLIYLVRSFGLGVGAGNIEHWIVHNPILEVDAPNIHNWFMDILVAYGVVTFTLYIAMYIHILSKLYVSFKYHTSYFVRTSSLFLFAYVISFVFSSMSSASNIFIEWQWVYWGVIIAFVQLIQKKNRQTNIDAI